MRIGSGVSRGEEVVQELLGVTGVGGAARRARGGAGCAAERGGLLRHLAAAQGREDTADDGGEPAGEPAPYPGRLRAAARARSARGALSARGAGGRGRARAGAKIGGANA